MQGDGLMSLTSESPTLTQSPRCQTEFTKAGKHTSPGTCCAAISLSSSASLVEVLASVFWVVILAALDPRPSSIARGGTWQQIIRGTRSSCVFSQQLRALCRSLSTIRSMVTLSFQKTAFCILLFDLVTGLFCCLVAASFRPIDTKEIAVTE